MEIVHEEEHLRAVLRTVHTPRAAGGLPGEDRSARRERAVPRAGVRGGAVGVDRVAERRCSEGLERVVEVPGRIGGGDVLARIIRVVVVDVRVDVRVRAGQCRGACREPRRQADRVLRPADRRARVVVPDESVRVVDEAGGRGSGRTSRRRRWVRRAGADHLRCYARRVPSTARSRRVSPRRRSGPSSDARLRRSREASPLERSPARRPASPTTIA